MPVAYNDRFEFFVRDLTAFRPHHQSHRAQTQPTTFASLCATVFIETNLICLFSGKYTPPQHDVKKKLAMNKPLTERSIVQFAQCDCPAASQRRRRFPSPSPPLFIATTRSSNSLTRVGPSAQSPTPLRRPIPPFAAGASNAADAKSNQTRRPHKTKKNGHEKRKKHDKYRNGGHGRLCFCASWCVSEIVV